MIDAESPFNQFRKNYYSRNGEDGLIQELFNRLQIGNSGWVVEFAHGTVAIYQIRII